VTVNLDGISEESEALRKIEDQIRPAAVEAGGRLLAIRVRLEGAAALHHSLKADPRRFSDEVQAAANRCTEDVWLEGLQINTLEPPTLISLDDAIASLDLNASLTALKGDPNLRASAAALLAEITTKLPRGIYTSDAPLADDLDSLLDDARALVIGRATPEY
jgi:DNA repair protein SbcD/Mre11